MGKNVGDDFKEGKVTLPIILAYGRSNSKEKEFWKGCFQKPITNKENFDSAKELIIKYNCLEDTITRASHFAEVAIDALSIFSDNPYKKSLIKLIQTSIKRIN